MEMAAGIKTQQQCTAERNGYWEDVAVQKEVEADDKLTRARKLADKHGVSMDVALSLMGVASKTGNQPPAEVKAGAETMPQEVEDTEEDGEEESE